MLTGRDTGGVKAAQFLAISLRSMRKTKRAGGGISLENKKVFCYCLATRLAVRKRRNVSVHKISSIPPENVFPKKNFLTKTFPREVYI